MNKMDDITCHWKGYTKKIYMDYNIYRNSVGENVIF